MQEQVDALGVEFSQEVEKDRPSRSTTDQAATQFGLFLGNPPCATRRL